MSKIYKLGILCTVLASTTAAAGGNTGFVSIEGIQQRECTSDKNFQITLKSDHLNPDGCANARVLDIACNNVSINTFVSLALTALAADKQINVYVNACDSEGQAKVVAMYLKN